MLFIITSKIITCNRKKTSHFKIVVIIFTYHEFVFVTRKNKKTLLVLNFALRIFFIFPKNYVSLNTNWFYLNTRCTVYTIYKPKEYSMSWELLHKKSSINLRGTHLSICMSPIMLCIISISSFPICWTLHMCNILTSSHFYINVYIILEFLQCEDKWILKNGAEHYDGFNMKLKL